MENDNKKSGIIYNVLVLIIFSILLKGIGFVNRMVTAFYFGTSEKMDVFYNVSGFIEAITAIILAGLTVGIINIYLKQDKDRKNEFISNTIIYTLAIMSIIIVIMLVFSNVVSELLAPGLRGEMRVYMNTLLKIMSIVFPFQALITVFGAVLQAEEKFKQIKLSGAISSGLSIICIILFNGLIGENSIVIAFILAYVINSIYYIYNARNKFSFKPKYVFRDSNLKKLLLMTLPLLVGQAAHQVNLIIDKSLASTITVGAVSALSYCTVLYLFIEGVFINSIVTVIVPKFAKSVNNNAHNQVAASTRKGIVGIVCLLALITIFCVFNSDTIIEIVYMRGNFNQKSLELTSSALKGYVIGLPFLAIRDIMNSVYYAYGDTKYPVFANIVSVCVNIVLNFLLYKDFGLMGITLATSISNMVSALLLLLNAKKHNKDICDRMLIKELFFILVSVCIQSGSWYIIIKFINDKFFEMLVGGIVSIGIQILMLVISHSYLYTVIKEKLSGRKEKV